MENKRQCATEGCKNISKTKTCGTCRSRKYAQSHPIQYCYNALRNNARRRNKPFEITFEEFKKFAIETDYINKRGRSSTSFTIDRKDPTKGYTPDNIQVLTNAGNVRKKAYIDSHWDPNQRRMEFYTNTFYPENATDLAAICGF